MTPLQKAFQEWMDLQPREAKIAASIEMRKNMAGQTRRYDLPTHFDGNCCTYSHFTYDLSRLLVALPDNRVCARERAWRRYVAIRDGMSDGNLLQ